MKPIIQRSICYRIKRDILFAFLWLLSVNLTAQTNLAVNGDPSFNLSISNLPSLGCGTSLVSLCNQTDNQCYLTTGASNEIKPVGYNGVYITSVERPDTIILSLTNQVAPVFGWDIESFKVEDGDSEDAQLINITEAGEPNTFRARLILNPQEVRVENGMAPIQTLELSIGSRYFNSSGAVTKRLNIRIPFIVTGPTTDIITPRGITTTPKIPYLVLHDPPGDGSFSSYATNTETCRSFATSYALDASTRVWGRVKLGFETKGTVPTEIYAQVEGGVSVELNQSTQQASELCISTASTISTPVDDSNPGSGSDLFIGSGQTLEYGIAENLVYDPQTCSTKIEKGLAFRSTGTVANFAFTENQIKDDIKVQQSIYDNTNNDALLRTRALAQVNAWNQVLALNEQNKAAARNTTSVSIDQISGGASISKETAMTSSIAREITSTIVVAQDLAVEVGAETAGSGGAGGVSIEIRSEFGDIRTNTAANTRSIGYTLADDDQGDLIAVDVKRDPMYGTPLFFLQENSRTSCPFEGGIQRDFPELTATASCTQGKNIVIENVPIGSAANLNLNIGNKSGEERTYYLALDGSSNVNGAKINVSGVELNTNDNGIPYAVPGNGVFNPQQPPLLTISQNPDNAGVLNYDNIKVFLYPICEGSSLSELGIVDLVNLSVRFTNDPNAKPRTIVDGVAADLTAPTLSCPSDRTVNVLPGVCSAIIQYDIPTATDNCGMPTVIKTTPGFESGANFFPGITTVSFQASDDNGNTSNCSFNVTVIDNEAPVITSCPESRTINTAAGVCSEVIRYEMPTATDNCVYSVERTEGPESGVNFFPGTTTVTHVFTDNYNNSATCSFSITIIDNEAPAVTNCPNDITVNALSGTCGTNVNYSTPTAFDNCTSTSEQTAGLASGETFPIGITTVTYVFTDNYNNSTNCTFNVNVRDEEAPVISSCPDSLVVTTAVDQCSTPVTWVAPTAIDNCQLASTVSSAELGGVFEVGKDTVTYTFTDLAGNVSNCIFEVIVLAGDTTFCSSVTTSVEEIQRVDNLFMLFPNPATKNVTLEMDNPEIADVWISIFDASGQQVYTKQAFNTIGHQLVNVELSNLSPGFYFVRLRSETRQGIREQNRKLILSR
ncbi:MAG: hypothetical protein Sapg2KO_26570 [Saprospiraceae bacterium]